MFIGRDVKQIFSEDKKSYKAIPYNRVWLEFDQTDESEEFERFNGTGKDKKTVLLPDGSVFQGLRPKENFTKADPAELVKPAMEYYQNTILAHPAPWDDSTTIPENKDYVGKVNAGWLLLLTKASGGEDLDIRAQIQQSERIPAAEDRTLMYKKAAKNAMDLFNSNPANIAKGRKTTVELELDKIRRSEIRNLVEDDGLDLETATAQVNEAWGISTQVPDAQANAA